MPFPPYELGLEALALGILTPGTIKRAALEKNCCTNARAIMDGITLDIEDHTPIYHLAQSKHTCVSRG
jgi:hypothetical protein